MRLTTQTDFGLKRRATIAEVAGLYGVSINHIAKVVNLLARHHLVRSIRGVGGGIELAKPADRISVGEVIRIFEGNMHLLECVGTENVCSIESFCKLKSTLAEAERIQLEYLNTVTLADVAPTSKQFARSTPNLP